MSDTRKHHDSRSWYTFCGRLVAAMLLTGDPESLDALKIDTALICKTCQRVRGARERGRHDSLSRH
jgi:hypothetical protein